MKKKHKYKFKYEKNIDNNFIVGKKFVLEKKCPIFKKKKSKKPSNLLKYSIDGTKNRSIQIIDNFRK